MENMNLQKAVQIINFFARKEEAKKVDYIKLLKLIYLTDKYMLTRYGRMLTYDRYYALKRGPVPTTIKGIAEGIVTNRTSDAVNPFFPVSEEYCLSYLKHATNSSETDTWNIESIGEFEDDLFSNAEIKAMETVFDEFGSYDKWELCRLTHEFPEWKAHEIDEDMKPSAPMRTIEFFSYSGIPKLDNFFNPDQADMALKQQFYSKKLEPES